MSLSKNSVKKLQRRKPKCRNTKYIQVLEVRNENLKSQRNRAEQFSNGK